MPKLNTKYQGEVEVRQEEIITFEQGLPGFVDEFAFVILPFAEESPFFILQSVKTEGLAFILANPFPFFQDYDFKLDENVINQLHIQSEQDVSILVVLTVQEPFTKTTANLQAPIVLNIKAKLGKQIILTDARYTTKHLLTTTAKEDD